MILFKPYGNIAAMLWAIVVFVVLAVSYFAGYFLLGDCCFHSGFRGYHGRYGLMFVTRHYRYGWQKVLFQPAAYLETSLRGVPIITTESCFGERRCQTQRVRHAEGRFASSYSLVCSPPLARRKVSLIGATGFGR